MTNQEMMLWSRLKGKQIGQKFRRQHGIGRYIVDFYCPKLQLAIEVDGDDHSERLEHDKERDEYMCSIGNTVLRFSNYEVNTNLEGVLIGIGVVISKLMSQS